MAKSNYLENAFLNLIFNGVAIPELADNAGVDPLTELYISLHTANPDEAGTQDTNETAYDGYARIAIQRDGSGWTVTGNSVSPAANIEFGECVGTPGDPITHVAIGTEPTGAGDVLYYGELTPAINTAVGVIPRITTNSSITEN